MEVSGQLHATTVLPLEGYTLYRRLEDPHSRSGPCGEKTKQRTVCNIRFEVFTAVTLKNAFFWDVTSCDFFEPTFRRNVDSHKITRRHIEEDGVL
jgi:hypothetical protein